MTVNTVLIINTDENCQSVRELRYIGALIIGAIIYASTLVVAKILSEYEVWVLWWTTYPLAWLADPLTLIGTVLAISVTLILIIKESMFVRTRRIRR